MIRAVVTSLAPWHEVLVFGRGARGRRRFAFSPREGPPVVVGELVAVEVVITPDTQRARILRRLRRQAPGWGASGRRPCRGVS